MHTRQPLKSPPSIFTAHSYMLNISTQNISTNIHDVTHALNVTEFIWSHWLTLDIFMTN